MIVYMGYLRMTLIGRPSNVTDFLVDGELPMFSALQKYPD
jgi:hypothetical protein